MFQSLTGSIQTIEKGYELYGITKVSIPHRFDSNVKPPKEKGWVLVRFNPSQVRFKLIKNLFESNL